MPFPQQQSRPFTRAGIEALPQGQNGVYGIFNAQNWIYIGKGDIRDRLLRHLTGNEVAEICIRNGGATAFYIEVTQNMDAREVQLLNEIGTTCNQRRG